MQVFKLFFKVLRKYIGSIIMYGCIFIGLVMGIIVPQATKNNTEEYTQKKSKFAFFDNDESKLSGVVFDYLDGRHKLVEIADDEKETIQDELYNMNVDCVIQVNAGFEEAFYEGNAEEYLEIFEIPNGIGSMLIKQHINSYLTVVETYVNAGFTIEEAAQKAVEASELAVDVNFASESNSDIKPIQYFFTYLSWVFIAMSVESLSAVLNSLSKKEVKNRIECSPYKFVRMNLETILAVVVTGIVIWAICMGVAAVGFPNEVKALTFVLYALNALCIMAVALAMTFVVSKLTENKQVISLMANILGLGMAFLCGVFVPLEVLSSSVVKVAHFLPVYWNVKGVNLIASYESSDFGTVMSYMGIQILFAVAIMCVGMVIARRKRGIAA
ncbi:MAG: ABC transporter permease [Lachnospiraceae bacterium]|nr:ABC transporter permease [Lachnospiraceae bacterium]